MFQGKWRIMLLILNNLPTPNVIIIKLRTGAGGSRNTSILDVSKLQNPEAKVADDPPASLASINVSTLTCIAVSNIRILNTWNRMQC